MTGAGGQQPGAFVGRTEEIARLAGALEVEHRSVVLTGPAGIGKTRLAEEVAGRLVEIGWGRRYFTAFAGAELIPLLPFAGLLDAEDSSLALVDRFVALADRLRSESEGRTLLIVVDNCQWLDDASASFVRHLLATEAARLLLVARSDSALHPSLSELVASPGLHHLRLGPLNRSQTEELLAEALGGPVSAGVSSRVWALTEGVPVFVTELARTALEAGVLGFDNGRWEERQPINQVLGDVQTLIRTRYEHLPRPERRLIEVLAVAGSAGVSLLESLGFAESLARLVEEGLVTAEVSGRRIQVRLSHPIFDEVVLACLGPIEARQHKRRLLEAMVGTGLHRQGDRLLKTVWAADLGLAQDPAELIEVAEQIVDEFRGAFYRTSSAAAELPRQAHLHTAIRLLRAALEAGGGFAAAARLHTALVLAGVQTEAAEILGQMEELAVSTEERLAVSRLRFGWAAFTGDAQAAESANSEAALLARGSQAESVVRAEAAQLLLGTNRLSDAVDAARSVLADGSADAEARAQAMVALVAGMGPQGRPTSALALLDEELAQLSSQENPLLIGMLMAMRGVALTYQGALNEAAEIFDGGLALAEAMGNESGIGVFALGAGEVLLNRGRPASAVGPLTKAMVALRDLDPFTLRPMAMSAAAVAQCWLGRLEEAEALMKELLATRPLPETLNNGGRGWAWLTWCQGRRQEAVEILVNYAEDAGSRGALMDVVTACHDLARLGRTEGAESLEALAGQLEGPLAQAMIRHVLSLRKADGEGLGLASDSFVELGADLLGAEAAFAAAEAEARSGRPARAQRWLSRSRTLLARCEGALLPAPGSALANVNLLRNLTRREREVATLASLGLSDRSIAQELATSVRTVQNHLYRIYAKVGVNSRIELAGLLGAPDPSE